MSVGERFGPYELQRAIGQGGMGEVYEALDAERGRQVAIKRLVPQLANDENFRLRFERESRITARLSSPHVIPIHTFGEIDGRLFIDMRLVDGRDLEQVLVDEGPLAPEWAVHVVEQVAGALDAAHRQGLVHRDVKPSNIMIDQGASPRGHVYLVDFGIGRAVGGSTGALTSTGAVVGTLDYMAPEQFDGRAGAEVDVYSLGCVLFQCLTGRKPFPVEGFPALMRAHLSGPPPAPSEVVPTVPPAFDDVVRTALEKEPSARFPSAGALAAAAHRALAGPSGALSAGGRTLLADQSSAVRAPQDGSPGGTYVSASPGRAVSDPPPSSDPPDSEPPTRAYVSGPPGGDRPGGTDVGDSPSIDPAATDPPSDPPGGEPPSGGHPPGAVYAAGAVPHPAGPPPSQDPPGQRGGGRTLVIVGVVVAVLVLVVLGVLLAGGRTSTPPPPGPGTSAPYAPPPYTPPGSGY